MMGIMEYASLKRKSERYGGNFFRRFKATVNFVKLSGIQSKDAGSMDVGFISLVHKTTRKKGFSSYSLVSLIYLFVDDIGYLAID